jgi:diguanylate cyclase (GGDEF)-like protein/PAS domain S-box-containing protein
MNFSYAIYLIVSGVIALLVAYLGWWRRTAPGALALMALMLAMAVWSFAYAMQWFTGDAHGTWLKIAFFGIVTTPVAFHVLAQQFIGRGDWLTKRAYTLLLSIPVLTLLFLWTDPLHGLFLNKWPFTVENLIHHGGPWFYVFLAYSYGLMLINIILLFRAFLRSSSFYRRQIRVMLIGAVLPWMVNIVTVTGLISLDLTPIAFTVTGLLFAYGFFGYRMMDLVPSGRDVLFENMEDAIVVVDTQGRIVDINPKAMEYADPGMDLPYGKLLEAVFSCWTDMIPQFAQFEGRVEVKLERAPFSYLDLRVIPLHNRQGQLMGKLATWRDVSAQRQAEEQLRIFFRAVEQNPTAIVITDPEGSIEYVNPHFVQMTGHSLEEVRDKTPQVLKSGETSDELYVDLWQTVKAGQVWKGEILNRKKNGQLYWVRELIAPVLNDQGQATHFVAMQEDITERKHAEGELLVMNTRLQVQLAEIEQLHDQLREESIRDSLTRLFNRRFMEEVLDREVSRADRDPAPISVVMMDVDLFKSINDTYGHQAGDTVLQTLGSLLLENTRISDIACRYGGDEMVVVMPGATCEAAISRAEEWRVAFSMMEFTFGNARVHTTLSLGVASFPDHARSPNELLIAADKALYRAKNKRNSVELYDPASMANSNDRSDNIR